MKKISCYEAPSKLHDILCLIKAISSFNQQRSALLNQALIPPEDPQI